MYTFESRSSFVTSKTSLRPISSAHERAEVFFFDRGRPPPWKGEDDEEEAEDEKGGREHAMLAVLLLRCRSPR